MTPWVKARALVRCAAMAAGLVSLSAGLAPVLAEGTFISAPDRVDIAYDDMRGLLYISNGSRVLRYQLSTATFLDPIQLHGSLMGMDISPDRSTLAVADDSTAGRHNWIYLVNLDTLQDTKVMFPLDDIEGGTFDVAYDRFGQILVTSRLPGSGEVPFYRYDPASGVETFLGFIQQDAVVQSSAQGRYIAYEGSDSSGGPFGYFDSKRAKLKQANADVYLYEIGVNADASLYAVVSSAGTMIADKNLQLTGTTIGTIFNPQPDSAVFDPQKALVYFPWQKTSQVKVYSTKTWQEVDSFDFEDVFGDPENHAFVTGRAKTSADGSLLFVTVNGGVRYVETRHHHKG